MKFRVQEILQVSATDCGPAVITAFARGYGLFVEYGHIRQLCQTEADGTSFGQLEEVLEEIGIPVALSMLPPEHLISAHNEYLPCLGIVNSPTGALHIVMIASLSGGKVTIMDPGPGIYQDDKGSFIESVWCTDDLVDAAEWREYAGQVNFCGPLRNRIIDLFSNASTADDLIEQASADSTWRSIARLDAAVRFCEKMKRRGGINHSELIQLLTTAYSDESAEIPAQYWHVRAHDEETLTINGCFVISLDHDRIAAEENILSLPEEARSATGEKAVVHSQADSTWTDFLSLFGRSDRITLGVLPIIVGLIVYAEAILLRGLIGEEFYAYARNAWVSVSLLTAAFVLSAVGARWASDRIALRMGVQIGIRYRMKLQEALARCSPRFFELRPVSDLATRFHLIDLVTDVPDLIALVLRSASGVALAFGTICILNVTAASVFCVVALGVVLITSRFSRRILAVENRMKVAEGAMSLFYQNALKSRSPLKAHAAQSVVATEHERKLYLWGRAAQEMATSRMGVVGAQRLLIAVGFCGVAYAMVKANEHPLAVLLVLYWYSLGSADTIQISLGVLTWIPKLKVVLMRLGEAMYQVARGAESQDRFEDSEMEALFDRLGWQPETMDHDMVSTPHKAVSITFEDVQVVAHGQQVLAGVDLQIDAGLHVAVVGRSGAGKSTVASLLLGHQEPSSGEVRIDGRVLSGSLVEDLRSRTVWIDPAVHLWNDTLLRNIFLGRRSRDDLRPDVLYDKLELADIVTRLPYGGASSIGEEGRLLSGGEGQRVRIGRGLAMRNPSLVILDEAFRGLDYEKRRKLLSLVRRQWSSSTLLAVTHDIAEATQFDRIAVVAEGRVVEFGTPAQLARAGTIFHQYLEEHRRLQKFWADETLWKTVTIEEGRLSGG